MSSRTALGDRTNKGSDRRALLSAWKQKKANDGAENGSLGLGGSSLLASKRGRGISALGGAARVTGGPSRTSSSSDANKRQKTTTTWASSRASSRSKLAATTSAASFKIHSEPDNVEPRSKTIKFAEEPSDDSSAPTTTGARSALKGNLKYTSSRPMSARAKLMSDNVGDSDTGSQASGAIERALKRRSEAPVQQVPQPEVEEEVGHSKRRR